MRYRRLGASIVLVLLLGLVGTLAGPAWNPQPLEHTLVPETADTSIGSDAVTTPVGTYEVARHVVDVTVDDGVTIRATIAEPVGAPGARPGMVFMHGAGTATHEGFADTTTALASAGVVTMVPDKREDTYSTRSRNYVSMAEDYLDSWDVLRDWPGVDPDNVGVYGESEGAMSAPVAAVLEPEVAFVVLVSAPVLPIREQGAFAADSYLREVGVPDRLLRAIPRLIGATFPGGGFEYFDFDVSPFQEQLTQPVLLVYGTGDQSMPIVQGTQVVLDDLAVAGNGDYTVRFYADANHGIRVGSDLVPAFPEDLARWVLGLPATADAPPRIAGADPVQRFRAAPVDHPRWYASGDMILITFAVGLGLLALGGVLALAGQVPRLLGRRPSSPAPRLGRATAGLAMAVLATWVIYLAYLLGVTSLALNYAHDFLLVQGGWLAVQLVGILAAVMVVLTVAAARRERSRTAAPGAAAARRTGALGWACVVCVLAGSLVLLVTAAYWGVYPAVP